MSSAKQVSGKCANRECDWADVCIHSETRDPSLSDPGGTVLRKCSGFIPFGCMIVHDEKPDEWTNGDHSDLCQVWQAASDLGDVCGAVPVLRR